MLEVWIMKEQSIIACCWGHNEFSDKPCPCFNATAWEKWDWDERKMASVWRYMRSWVHDNNPDRIDWIKAVAKCRKFHEDYMRLKLESKKSRQDGES